MLLSGVLEARWAWGGVVGGLLVCRDIRMSLLGLGIRRGLLLKVDSGSRLSSVSIPRYPIACLILMLVRKVCVPVLLKSVQPFQQSSRYHFLYRLSIFAHLDVYRHTVAYLRVSVRLLLKASRQSADLMDLTFELDIRGYGGQILEICSCRYCLPSTAFALVLRF